MSEILTPSNITFALGVIGIIFSIFLYFRNPQEALDKRTAILEVEGDGQHNLISEKMKWEREMNDGRFKEMQDNIKEAMAMGQNHIHTVDTKVDKLALEVQELGRHVVKLATIIDERIPKK